MIRFKNLLSLSLLVVVVSNITALARPNAGYNGYRQKLLKTTGGCKPSGSSLTGNCEKTNIPKTINIRDITQATTGLLILTSVIYIQLFIFRVFFF